MKSILKTAAGTAIGMFAVSVVTTAVMALSWKPLMKWSVKQSVKMSNDIEEILDEDN